MQNQKSMDNEDRLSILPESIIHHILSFLPSTKDAARTAVLSKSWRYRWNSVPKLIFTNYSYCEGEQSFPKFIDNALLFYGGSGMEKFVIKLYTDHLIFLKELYTQLAKWLCFATLKGVKDVILRFCDKNLFFGGFDYGNFQLPQCFYNNSSLIKLKTCCCDFVPSRSVNWPSLKSLSIKFTYLSNEIMRSILLGSPFLESLELGGCCNSKFDHLHFDPKHLKRLALYPIGSSSQLSLKISGPSIESLEFMRDDYPFEDIIVVNVPLIVSATINFYNEDIYDLNEDAEIVQGLFQQVVQAKKLIIGVWCLQALSYLESKAMSPSAVEEQPSPLSNTECLILNVSETDPFHICVPGIARTLRISSNLEKLVINFLRPNSQFISFEEDMEGCYNYAKNFMSQKTNFTCLSSHLKTVCITGLSTDLLEYKYVLEFLGYLLKNSSVLEKMVFYDMQQSGTDFALEVSQILLSFPRASPDAIILMK